MKYNPLHVLVDSFAMTLFLRKKKKETVHVFLGRVTYCCNYDQLLPRSSLFIHPLPPVVKLPLSLFGENIQDLLSENFKYMILTIVIMPYVLSPEIIHPIMESLYPLANVSPFLLPAPPQCPATTILYSVLLKFSTFIDYAFGEIV